MYGFEQITATLTKWGNLQTPPKPRLLNSTDGGCVVQKQRAVLAHLWLEALRGVPPEQRGYNTMLIAAFIVDLASRNPHPPTASRIARGLHLPRTTVTRMLQRMERAGLLGRDEGNGYYPTYPPHTERGVQHRVSMVLRAAKELTEIGHQNLFSDGQQQTTHVNAATGGRDREGT
jgi:DNA-binding MarR family transcriptional regulator